MRSIYLQEGSVPITSDSDALKSGIVTPLLSNLDLAWDLKLFEAELLAVVDEFPECCAGDVHVVTHVLQ